MTEADLITAVVECLAAADGVVPAALDYSLYDYVDTDVLAKLDDLDDACWEFTFRVPDHEVTLTAGGAIYIDGTLHRSRSDDTADEPRSTVQADTEIQQRFPALDDLPGVIYRCRNERGWPIDYISEGCRKLTGYDPNAFIVGGISYGADVIHPDDRAAVWEQVQTALQADEPFSLTYRIRTVDGDQKRVWGRGRGIPERDEVALVGFIVDITDVRNRSMIPDEA